MPNRDKTGPRSGSQGPRDGRGQGKGRAPRQDRHQEGRGPGAPRGDKDPQQGKRIKAIYCYYYCSRD